jgi:hypothetical protein
MSIPGQTEVVGLRDDGAEQTVYRFGFDLFQEIAFLLSTGQPVENAGYPTLDRHITVMRDCILQSGIALLEIPPAPAGQKFTVCLTHDIDFVGIRNHRLDHTCWGFLYRATIQTTAGFLTGKTSFRELARNWKAALSLPLVYLGWAADFWMTFDWYLRVESGLRPTYFFIPFKGRAGEGVRARHPARRAAPYELAQLGALLGKLQAAGCEIGVHGIDAWHSADKGREELTKVAQLTKGSNLGVRMHWLLRDLDTYRVLEQAGFDYDSTGGYNETAGYLYGTGQPFRPPGAKRLLELPLHIQDGALFYKDRLGLTPQAAAAICRTMLQNVHDHGGVLTVLWHDRSPAPERCWGEFYEELVSALKAEQAWFASAGEVTRWFRARRAVKFERVGAGAVRARLCGPQRAVSPPFNLKIWGGIRHNDSQPMETDRNLPWTGEPAVEIQNLSLVEAFRRASFVSSPVLA